MQLLSQISKTLKNIDNSYFNLKRNLYYIKLIFLQSTPKIKADLTEKSKINSKISFISSPKLISYTLNFKFAKNIAFFHQIKRF